MPPDEPPHAGTPSAHPHRRRSDVPDAATLLAADHQAALSLFQDYARLGARHAAPAELAALADRLCTAIEVHMQVEEELFYPICRLHLRDPAWLDEAVAEHAGARALIEQLRALPPQDTARDALMGVLREAFTRHVQEEETLLFPRARRWMETDALGEALQARQARLLERARQKPLHPAA